MAWLFVVSALVGVEVMTVENRTSSRGTSSWSLVDGRLGIGRVG